MRQDVREGGRLPDHELHDQDGIACRPIGAGREPDGASPAARRLRSEGRIEDAEVRAEIEDAALTFAHHLNRVGSAVPAEP